MLEPKKYRNVVVLGHQSSGKTSLVESLIYTAGGIPSKGEVEKKNTVSDYTSDEQKRGASIQTAVIPVNYGGYKFNFLDIPGNDDFISETIGVTRIVKGGILVVDASVGVQVGTVKHWNQLRKRGIPTFIYLNKMDKPNVNPDKALSELSEKGLTAEEWGGDTLVVKGSALKGQGIAQLLDAILTLTEMLELKANPNRDGMGTCIEANMDKGLGPVTTLLVQNGTIRKGDFIVLGEVYGRVRAIFNDLGQELKYAIPGQPVKITGLSEVPVPGSKWLVIKDENLAKELARKVKEKNINIFRSQIKQIDPNDTSKRLNLVIKCDVQGSLEAIKGMLEKVKIEGATIDIVRAAIGAISESDIQLAKASHARIIGFNVRPNKDIKDLAHEQMIKFHFYNVIYKLKEDVINMLYGSLDPVSVEEDLGEAEVKQTWRHSEIGTIAGVAVTSGKILRNALARVIRDGKEVYHNEIASLRHGKETVNEVTSGHECGLVIKNFNDVKVGDIIQIYKNVDKSAKDIAENKK